MPEDKHTHLFRVPEPLEKLFAELDQLERVSPAAAADAGRVRDALRAALAAEARGEVNEAVAGISRAMQALAALAARVDPSEGREMSAVAEQFARALVRGDAAEAREATDRMRERAGAKIVKKDG